MYILLAGLMLIGCSSQSNVKASKGKTSKEESELKVPQTLLFTLEIESK
ncbi:hypothetical protein P2Q57_21560 [Peribacillus frigoritolerans]|nr:hypothetical protein [Peribacillus frigoritolerans]